VNPAARLREALAARRSLRLTLYALALVLAAALAVGSWGLWRFQTFLDSAPETPGREVVVDIVPGSALARVAAQLEREGVVTDALLFRLLGRLDGQGARVRAGEFALHTGWPPRQVLRALTEGQTVLHKLVLPEGLTWWQAGRVVEQSGLASFESFERAVHDPALLAAYNIPGPSAEGFLYPETYLVPRPRDGDAAPIVAAMLAAFWAQAGARLWPDGPPPADEMLRLVTLAAMVEKETALPGERARVAGVYANRIRLGMLMQCDPTVIYGLGPDFNGNLTRADLQDEANPYNTYRRKGLPPGPICSPGLEALLAARSPEKHALLYFVARRDGSHVFSRSLDEHNSAVREHQLRRR
jgi:UPF0755 protein